MRFTLWFCFSIVLLAIQFIFVLKLQVQITVDLYKNYQSMQNVKDDGMAKVYNEWMLSVQQSAQKEDVDNSVKSINSVSKAIGLFFAGQSRDQLLI